VDNEGFNSLTVIDPKTAKPIGSVPATHPYNLYFTPDGSGRDRHSRQVTASWRIGGSPDMTTLSPDGAQLWTSGRFARAVYFFPNPGRLSLGHNGMYR
jgi:hypothetical protein